MNNTSPKKQHSVSANQDLRSGNISAPKKKEGGHRGHESMPRGIKQHRANSNRIKHLIVAAASISILVTLVIALTYIFIHTRLTHQQSEQEVENSNNTADGLIRDQQGAHLGQSRVEFDGSVWRIVVSTTIPTANPTQSYHGWLRDSDTELRLYAGELFPIHDDQYSLTYTTHEDVSSIARFDVFQITTSNQIDDTDRQHILLEWRLSVKDALKVPVTE